MTLPADSSYPGTMDTKPTQCATSAQASKLALIWLHRGCTGQGTRRILDLPRVKHSSSAHPALNCFSLAVSGEPVLSCVTCTAGQSCMTAFTCMSSKKGTFTQCCANKRVTSLTWLSSFMEDSTLEDQWLQGLHHTYRSFLLCQVACVHRFGDHVAESTPFWQEVQRRDEGAIVTLLKSKSTNQVILAGACCCPKYAQLADVANPAILTPITHAVRSTPTWQTLACLSWWCSATSYTW